MTPAPGTPVKRAARPPGRDLPRIRLAEFARKLSRWEPLFDIASGLPHLDPPRPAGSPRRNDGRPPKFPPEAYLILGAIRGEIASMREAERTLADRGIWESVRSELHKRFPHYEGLAPGSRAPTRSGFDRWARSLSVADRKAFSAQFSKVMAELALAMGMFDPNRHDLTHPIVADQLLGDGSHLTAMFNAMGGEMQVDPVTGEMFEKRHDPDAQKQIHRSEEEIDVVASAGVHHGLIHGTTGHVNENVVLAAYHVPKGQGNSEMELGLAQVEALRRLLPGASGVMWDKAMRGTHIDRLYQWGLQGHARVSDAPGGGPKEKLIEVAVITKGTQRVGNLPLVALGGAAHVRVVLDGDPHLVRLIPRQTRRLKNRSTRSRRYRWHKEYEVPDDPRIPARFRNGHLRVRLDTSAGDKDRGLNRAEALRPVAQGDADWDEVGGQRSRAESMFSLLKKSWPAAAGRRSARIRTVGAHRQRLWILTWALGQNLRAWEAFRSRKNRIRSMGRPPDLAAA